MSSAEESAYDGSDASEDSGSASYDDMSDDGDDWDELERKAAKCTCHVRMVWVNMLVLTRVRFCVTADSKRAEGAKARGESDDSDNDRPKKKGAQKGAKGAKGKANGKR